MQAVSPTDVLYEDYSPEVQLSRIELAGAIARSPVSVPSSWLPEAASTSKLTMIVRTPDNGSVQTSVPTVTLHFSRRAESLQVQIVEVSDSVARRYADAILSQGEAVPVPAGRGVAGGMGAAIDTGRYLIRAGYHDGGPPLQGANDPRVESLQAMAQQLLSDLQPGSRHRSS
jgi:hypothetical protein